jgi:hypothetical protein
MNANSPHERKLRRLRLTRKLALLAVSSLALPAIAFASSTRTNSVAGTLQGTEKGMVSMQIVVKRGRPTLVKKIKYRDLELKCDDGSGRSLSGAIPRIRVAFTANRDPKRRYYVAHAADDDGPGGYTFEARPNRRGTRVTGFIEIEGADANKVDSCIGTYKFIAKKR